MNNIKKSKIFWTNVISMTVIILGLLNPDVLTALGFSDHGKFLTIIGLISAVLSAFLRTFFNNPIPTDTLKIGGRPPREKKPTQIIGEDTFIFKGNDFTDTDSIYYATTEGGDQIPATIASINNFPNSQHIVFAEKIEFTNLEDLTFYIY